MGCGLFMQSSTRRLDFVGERGDDVVAESGAGLRIGSRIAVGTSGIGSETLLSMAAEGSLKSIFALA